MKILQMKPSLLLLCLLAVCLLLGGCSTIKVVESWQNESFTGHRYQKLLLVGFAHDENLRTMAEDIIVDELRRSNVTAVASHTLMKEIDSAKRDDIVAAVRKAGADGVLTIRAVAKGQTNVTQGGQSGGIYGMATNVGGAVLPAATNYSLATLQTNLYDSATAGLVWSATVSTYDAREVAKVSRELASFFLRNMRQNGFL